MSFSKRTRWIVGIPFFAGLAAAWVWLLASTPRRTLLHILVLGIALAIVFELVARKLQSPRGTLERFLLELAFAALTMIVAALLMSASPAH